MLGLGPTSTLSSTTTTTHAAASPFAVITMPTSTNCLTRTLSEGELSIYSSVSSVRDAIASCRRTRDSIRKSRASIRALRLESNHILQEAHDLRREMELLLIDRPHIIMSSKTNNNINQTDEEEEESDQESDSGTASQPTLGSEVSDLTFEMGSSSMYE